MTEKPTMSEGEIAALDALLASHEHLCRVLVVRDETWATWERGKEAILALRAQNQKLVEAADEAADAFGMVLDVLRREAPGTPLNSHRYTNLGVRAQRALEALHATRPAEGKEERSIR
jgi:hypothetical protein